MSSGLFKWVIAAVFGFQTVAVIAAVAAMLCLIH